MARVRVLYSGQVQGVGFRSRVASCARGFNVFGFVRNRSDRTVELVAEGERSELQRFLNEVDQEMSGFIRSRTIDFTEPKREFSRFEIAETVLVRN